MKLNVIGLCTIFLLTLPVVSLSSATGNQAVTDLNTAKELIASQDVGKISTFILRKCMSGSKRPKEACLLIIPESVKLNNKPGTLPIAIMAYQRIGEPEAAQQFLDTYKVSHPRDPYISASQKKIDREKNQKKDKYKKYVISISDVQPGPRTPVKDSSQPVVSGNQAQVDLNKAKQLVGSQDLRKINVFLQKKCIGGTKRPKEACLLIISKYLELQPKVTGIQTATRAYVRIGALGEAQKALDAYRIAHPENTYIPKSQQKIDSTRALKTNHNLKYVITVTDSPPVPSKVTKRQNAFTSPEKSKLARKLQFKEITIIHKTPSKRTELGYAVALTPDGYLATSSKVIDSLDTILVKVPGKNVGDYKARVVSTYNGVTLLKIDPYEPLEILPTKIVSEKTPVGILYDRKILDGFAQFQGELLRTTIPVPYKKEYKVIPQGGAILTADSQLVGVAVVKGATFSAVPIADLVKIIDEQSAVASIDKNAAQLYDFSWDTSKAEIMKTLKKYYANVGVVSSKSLHKLEYFDHRGFRSVVSPIAPELFSYEKEFTDRYMNDYKQNEHKVVEVAKLYFYTGELLFGGASSKVSIPSGEIIYSNATQKPILMFFNVRNSDCSNYSQLLEDKHGQSTFEDHITIEDGWDVYVTSWSSTDYDSSSVLKTIRRLGIGEAMGCDVLLLHHDNIAEFGKVVAETLNL